MANKFKASSLVAPAFAVLFAFAGAAHAQGIVPKAAPDKLELLSQRLAANAEAKTVEAPAVVQADAPGKRLDGPTKQSAATSPAINKAISPGARAKACPGGVCKAGGDGGTEDGGKTGVGEIGPTTILNDTQGKDMQAAWDGWADLYEAYGRSPILFDPADYEDSNGERDYPSYSTAENRMYPELARQKQEITTFAGTNSGDPNTRTMETLQLGVDREILKSSMAIYQPANKLNASFADDEFERDNHLNLFKSLRGVAVMTLSYLDKTVAAGLATTQAQVDQNTTHDLLKQISWSTQRMAHPELSRVYNDTDEKLEACIRHYDDNKENANGDWSFYLDDTVWTEMEQDCQGGATGTAAPCGPEPTASASASSSSGAVKGGYYRYCVCCAEVASKANKALRNQDEGLDDEDCKDGYSLVQRVFFGLRAPTDGEKADYVKVVVKAFRNMYGDVMFGKKEGTGGSSVSDSQMQINFRYPELSPALKIMILRDGSDANSSCDANKLACPIAGTYVHEGICPALVELIKKYPNVGDDGSSSAGSSACSGGSSNNRQLWVQASLGKLVTPLDLKAIRSLGGIDDTVQLDASWKPKGAIYTYLQAFCDASAISAFKRFHVRMKSIVEDHLLQNSVASPWEKQALMNLVNRVDEYVRLAEIDANASLQARQMQAGVTMEYARAKETAHSAAAETMQNGQFVQGLSFSIDSFGMSTQNLKSTNGNAPAN